MEAEAEVGNSSKRARTRTPISDTVKTKHGLSIDRDHLLSLIADTLDILGATDAAQSVEAAITNNGKQQNEKQKLFSQIKREIRRGQWHAVLAALPSLPVSRDTRSRISLKCQQEKFREDWIEAIHSKQSMALQVRCVENLQAAVREYCEASHSQSQAQAMSDGLHASGHDNGEDDDSDGHDLDVHADWFNEIQSLARLLLVDSPNANDESELTNIADSRSSLCDWLDDLMLTNNNDNPMPTSFNLLDLIENSVNKQNHQCSLVQHTDAHYHHAGDSESQSLQQHCSLSFDTANALILSNGHTDEVLFVAWSHQHTLLASVSRDCTAIIRQRDDFGGIRVQSVLRGHPSPIWHCAWSSDGSRIAVSGSSTVVTVFEVSTGSVVMQCESGHREYVQSSAFLNNDRELLTVSPDKFAVVRDMASQRSRTVSGVDIASDLVVMRGRVFISTHTGRIVMIENLSYQTATSAIVHTIVSESTPVVSIAVSPDQKFVVALTVKPSQLLLYSYDSHSRKAVKLGAYSDFIQSRLVLRACFIGSHSQFLAVGSEDCSIHIVHRESMKCIAVITGHTGAVNAIDWQGNSDGEGENVIASCSDDGSVRVWRSQSHHSRQCRQWNAIARH